MNILSRRSRRRLLALAAAPVVAAVLLPASAWAIVDMTGYYQPIFHEDQPERVPGPDAGDYAGMPINDAARSRADTWTGSLLTLTERQCIPHPSTYGMRGVGNLHIWDTRDPAGQELVKFDAHIVWEAQHREIWMDGRAHPPENAPHTWQGFATGAWEGDVLVVKTTHLKPGWIRRNGLPLSDRATLTERFIRHGDILNHVMMIEDPAYLTEPLVKTNVWRIMAAPNMGAYPCRPAVEIDRPQGEVPHNAFRDQAASAEFAAKHKMPVAAARGGAETAMPEFFETLPTAQRTATGGSR